MVTAIIAIYAGCVSCVFNVIRGNGNLVTSEKTVSEFEKINVSGSAEVRFHVSQEYRTVVTVDENIYEYVEIVTKNNVLTIRTKNGYFYSFTKFLVDVYCPVLTGFSVSGSGSFQNIDKITTPTFETSISGSGKVEGIIECESFSASISGSGKIVVSGNSKNADINISGSGKFSGNDFIISDATIRVSGSGNIDVHVTDNLNVSISGSGGINYSGEPKINSNVSGLGRIRKL